jgi:hypothetical protein
VGFSTFDGACFATNGFVFGGDSGGMSLRVEMAMGT